MKIPDLKIPKNPNFSCGPTRKPEGWNVRNLNKKFLGRYHRTSDVVKYIEQIINRIKKILGIPAEYKILTVPGSTTGAMEAVIWSFLGEKKITSIVYDYWAQLWDSDLKKLNLDVETRVSLNGEIPSFKNIPLDNDILFVWTGTSTGMSINQINDFEANHQRLIISDITSAVFIYDIPWKKIDISVFSWQKALGGEAQHGMIVLSPKSWERLKKNKKIPKLLDLANHDFLINTPSLLSFADLEICLDAYEKRGNLHENNKICIQNKNVIDDWLNSNIFLKRFSKSEIFDALTPSYMIPKKKIN